MNFRNKDMPLWDCARSRTASPAFIVQAETERQAAARAAAVVVLCHGAYWLEGIHGELHLTRRLEGEPLTVPAFGDGWFTVLDEYVQSTFSPLAS